MAHTNPVMLVPLAMSPPQAPSRSRLAIGRIIRMAPGITSGGPITSGGRDTGQQTATVKESGSAGTTSSGDNQKELSFSCERRFRSLRCRAPSPARLEHPETLVAWLKHAIALTHRLFARFVKARMPFGQPAVRREFGFCRRFQELGKSCEIR
jgi:hypothetical protein